MTPREARKALDLLDRIFYCDVKANADRTTETGRQRWRDKQNATRSELAGLLEKFTGN